MRIKAKLAAGALLAAALIAGCTPPGGTAAVVNGETLSVSEVEDAMAIRVFLQPQANTPPPEAQDILQMLIEGRVAVDVASAHGITFSAAEATKLLDALNGQGLKVEDEYPAALLDIVRAISVAGSLQGNPVEQQVAAEVNEFRGSSTIEINPRYGQWDPSRGGLVSNVPEWINFAG